MRKQEPHEARARRGTFPLRYGISTPFGEYKIYYSARVVVKCDDQQCCSSRRSSLHLVLHDRFLSLPYPITQVNGHSTIPNPEHHDGKTFAPFLIRHCLPIQPLHAFMSMPYDLYCPSLRDHVEKRCCNTCGIYFAFTAKVANIDVRLIMYEPYKHAKCEPRELSQDELLSFCVQAITILNSVMLLILVPALFSISPPSPIVNFNPDLALDSDPSSVLDSALQFAFDFDSATDRNCDTDKAEAKRCITMRAAVVLTFHCWLVLLSHCGTSPSAGDDREWVTSLIDLIELEYEDHCEQRAIATWDELLGGTGALQKKLEREKAFGMFARTQAQDVRDALAAHALGDDDSELRRKVKLILEPGDLLLDTDQWNRLVTFSETAIHNLRFADDYDCSANTTCTLSELRRTFSSQHDKEVLRRMKESWERKLPDRAVYQQQILPLIRNASKVNNYSTVEEYWNSLSEYEGAVLKARELWNQVQPLYKKLQKYVVLRLLGPDSVGEPLPVYLLGTLLGDDWSNLIESLLPKHPDIYQKIHANLRLKNIGGREAFREAASLLNNLNFGVVDQDFWNMSKFDGTCPTVLVDSCKPNKVKAFTCKDVSLGHYMDAHESLTAVKYKEIVAIHSNKTYILREANRFSALYEAMPGVVSLLAVTPHALDRAGLYPFKRYTYNPNHHRLILQLLVALRDLPRLNYYLAVDEWRLQALTSTVTSSAGVSNWTEFRTKFSMITPSDNDLLGDPYVLRNQPYVGKFLGMILKYQIYQSYAEELFIDEDDLIQYISTNNGRLMEAMGKGYAFKILEMLDDLLSQRENGLEAVALTDYFRLLEEYLDNQLDPNEPKQSIDYNEPPEEVVEENEIPVNEPVQKTDDTHENLMVNVIDTGDDGGHQKHGSETSTVGVLEIKNPVAVANGNHENDQDGATKHASYNTYWWIGIGVALAIAVIIIAIIARKRHSHRKQLERQRRTENTHA